MNDRLLDSASNPLPTTIYKYFKLNQRVYELLINGHLWFSSFLDFNDPFDCNMHDDVIYKENDVRAFFKTVNAKDHSGTLNDEEVELSVKAWKDNPKQMESNVIKPMKSYLKNYGICCFSERKDSIIMWSHYADSHKGVCIGFNTAELSFNEIDRIVYQSAFPEINWLRNLNQSFKNMILTKSIEWAYEKEIRIIEPIKGIKPFKRKALKEVILGAKCRTEDLFTIKSLLDISGYKHVDCKKAIQSNSKFEVTFANVKMEYDHNPTKGGDFDIPGGVVK
jgi:hypothetical protein